MERTKIKFLEVVFVQKDADIVLKEIFSGQIGHTDEVDKNE